MATVKRVPLLVHLETTKAMLRVVMMIKDPRSSKVFFFPYFSCIYILTGICKSNTQSTGLVEAHRYRISDFLMGRSTVLLLVLTKSPFLPVL